MSEDKKLFSLFYNGIGNADPDKEISLNEFFDILKQDSSLLKEIRKCETKNERDKIKAKLSYVTFGGTFSHRDGKSLKESSGFACFDIDGVKDLEERKKEVIENKYTYCLFISPSGKGFKFLVKIPKVKSNEEYQEYWNSISKHYNLPGTDKRVKDICRACYISFDENPYLNEDSELYTEKDLEDNQRKIISEVEIAETDEFLITEIMKKWEEGNRQNLCMYWGGVMRETYKYGFKHTANIIREVCRRTNDNEVDMRLKVIQDNYMKDEREVKGFKGLEEEEINVEEILKESKEIDYKIQIDKQIEELKEGESSKKINEVLGLITELNEIDKERYLEQIKKKTKTKIQTLEKSFNSIRKEKKEDKIVFVERKSHDGEIFTRIGQAKCFISAQPLYYERKGQIWLWDKESYSWIKKDETDILNLIRSILPQLDTINSKERNEILEALKQVGRMNKPQEIKSSWVQFKDKIYDIETGEVFDSTPEYFVSNPINWNVGEIEDTPTIDKYFKSWVNSEDDVKKLYEIISWVIVPKMFIHAFWFLHGPPGTGKSTFVNLLIKFIGEQNKTSTSIDRINNNARFETYNWYKKLLITMSEVSSANDLRNSGLLNQATGEDSIPYEIKGGDTFSGISYGKFIYPTNKWLKIDGEDGFGRRVRYLKFENRFEKEKDILSEIPEWEFENLAKKCLRVAKELWKKRNFTGDVSISERIKGYQEISKTELEWFIENECDITAPEGKIPFGEFHSKFMIYLQQLKKGTWSLIKVSKELKKLGFETRNHSWKVEGCNFRGESNFELKNTIFGIKIKEKEVKS